MIPHGQGEGLGRGTKNVTASTPNDAVKVASYLEVRTDQRTIMKIACTHDCPSILRLDRVHRARVIEKRRLSLQALVQWEVMAGGG